MFSLLLAGKTARPQVLAGRILAHVGTGCRLLQCLSRRHSLEKSFHLPVGDHRTPFHIRGLNIVPDSRGPRNFSCRQTAVLIVVHYLVNVPRHRINRRLH